VSPSRAISEDALLDGRLRLRQPAAGYRTAIDPVFLAAAVPAMTGCRALDLGCGVGAAALCLLARVPEAHVTGLELQPDFAELARENAALNGFAERLRVHCADMAKPGDVAPGIFDEVFCNPPHQPAGAASPPPDAAKGLATHEGATELADWADAALRFVRPGGGVTVIHRADRLDELLAALGRGAGGFVVFPLWPKRGRPAKRVLLRAVKGAKAPLRLAPGLVLHRDDGSYTAEAEAVLRGGQGLTL
jgi:tRNA1(Val) A37 N6-methylase TrmN6